MGLFCFSNWTKIILIWPKIPLFIKNIPYFTILGVIGHELMIRTSPNTLYTNKMQNFDQNCWKVTFLNCAASSSYLSSLDGICLCVCLSVLTFLRTAWTDLDEILHVGPPWSWLLTVRVSLLGMLWLPSNSQKTAYLGTFGHFLIQNLN